MPLAAWGYNADGELGDNTTTDRCVPVAVNTTRLTAGERFTHIFSGSSANHTLALVAPLASADIRDFSGQDLSGMDFKGATLSYANFSGAILTGANFKGAALSNANLTGANILGANFQSTAAIAAKLGWRSSNIFPLSMLRRTA